MRQADGSFRKFQILDNSTHKIITSENFHCVFNKQDGRTATWGQNWDDDPEMCPAGPIILDVEISTICHGPGTGPCKFCYKANTGKGINMSVQTFKQIFATFPKTVTQIAFGIGDLNANPDLTDIFEHCRQNNVVPNVTINGYGLDPYDDFLALFCGAVAVSNYERDLCYNAVQRLTKYQDLPDNDDVTLRQVNIHQLLCEDTLDKCHGLIEDIKSDPRLAKLNAVVFLLLKPKGRGVNLTQLKSKEKYQKLIDTLLDNKIRFGFDSCSANAFMQAVSGREDTATLGQMAEPCESTCFSYYISADAKGYPCSFCEGCQGIEPINMLKVDNFLEQVWYAPQTVEFRERLLANGRSCPVYDLNLTE